jgi:hypothetical protein
MIEKKKIFFFASFFLFDSALVDIPCKEDFFK